MSLAQVANRGNHVCAERIDPARPLNLAGALAATSQVESQNRESLGGKDSCGEYQMTAKSRARAAREHDAMLALVARREQAA